MKLHFLKAADGTPLTKSFTLNDKGEYEKTSYPAHLFEVDSKAVEVSNIDEFYAALTTAAEFNQALQKGELDRELRGESRAQRTIKDAPTEWILFDIDGLDGCDTVEEFVEKVLPAPFRNTSYIVQYSASHGIARSELSAHVFFLLEQAVTPKDMKNWLRALNLGNELLESQLELQRGNQSALKWPLDVSVAGNDKYVYIAPPVCTNFDDPLAGKRIELVTKDRGRADFHFAHPGRDGIRKLEKAKIQSLRTAEQLPKLSLRTVDHGGFDVLVDADPIEVTEYWFANGFFHLNINGGDSGAYWVNPKRPRYIHSFKDEPSRVLRKVAPEFWEKIKDDCEHEEMLVFRDVVTNTFYNAVYDPTEDRYEHLLPTSRGNIKDWADDWFGQDAPQTIPNYMLKFMPGENFTVDKKQKVVNKFQKTEYMKLEPSNVPVPPTVEKILMHVVNDDYDSYEWFLNWLAYIFQTRKKSRVAVVLHGEKGTGKGVLFNYILRPIFGDDYCRSEQQNDLKKDRFNDYMGGTLFVMLDESENDPDFRNTLFHCITEPRVRLRVAYAGAIEIDSYTNFILASNRPDGAPIEPNDRRFTVMGRQMVPLKEKYGLEIEDEIEQLLPGELSQFARHLAARAVDERKATAPMQSAAKSDMQDAAKDSIDKFLEAIAHGDFAYFMELRAVMAPTEIIAAGALGRWYETVNTNNPCPVPLAELFEVYVASGASRTAIAKFRSMLVKRGLPAPTDINIGDGRLTVGYEIQWVADTGKIEGYHHMFEGAKKPPARALDESRDVVSLR